MTATRLDLAELRRLHEAATPGPWRTSREDMDSFVGSSDGGLESVAYIYRDPADRIPVIGTSYRNDSRLIAAMRNALPALLSIAEAAEAWLERGSTLDTHAALRATLAAVRKEP